MFNKGDIVIVNRFYDGLEGASVGDRGVVFTSNDSMTIVTLDTFYPSCPLTPPFYNYELDLVARNQEEVTNA